MVELPEDASIETEKSETGQAEDSVIEEEKRKKMRCIGQIVSPPPPVSPPYRNDMRYIGITKNTGQSAVLGVAGITAVSVVLKNVTERVDDIMMESISESIKSAITKNNVAPDLTGLSDTELVKNTITKENNVQYNLKDGVDTVDKIMFQTEKNGLSSSESFAQNLNINWDGTTVKNTHERSKQINNTTTIDTADVTTFDVSTHDISSGRSGKASLTYDDGIVKSILSAEGNASYSLQDGMSLSSKLGHTTEAKGISIAQSISQGVDLKRNGMSYNIAQDNVLNIGKNTTFSTNDTTTFDATTTGVSVENKKSVKAAYDDGVWKQSLTAEGSAKVAFPDGVEAKGKITHKMGTESLSISDSISGNIKAGFKGVSAGVSHDTTMNVGKNVTISGSDSTKFDANFKDVSVGRSIKGSVGYDDGVVNDKVTVSADGKASYKKGVSGSLGAEHTYGVNDVASVTQGVKGNASFDGKKSTYGLDANNSVKIGNDKFNVQQSSKSSISHSSDGTLKVGGEIGRSVKAGPVEAGASVSGQKTYSENKESAEVEMKSTRGVQLTKGAKLTNEVSVKNTESAELDPEKNELTESTGMEIASKTRIELDRENASAIDVAAAAVVNTTAAITETVFNEAMKFEDSTTTKLGEGEDEEAAKKVAEEAQTEAEKEIEKQNQENQKEIEKEEENLQKEIESEEKELQKAEEELSQSEEELQQAEAEAEEKSIEEQVEEDTRISEELNSKSEELMDEHENAMGVDRAEYAEELEDYSYEQPGEGETGLESVNFSEGESSSPGSDGESADNSYDYAYGY